MSFRVALCVLLFAGVAAAQSLPPARHDGFVYGGRNRVDPDSVVVEAFFDPICPDSRDAWHPLKRAVRHYGRRVLLLVHLLPLPYHDNAFVASRALHVVNGLNASATFDMLGWFFKNQDKFYNAQTLNVSRSEVVERIVKSITEVIGDSYYSKLESDFKNKRTDHKTRVSFKYSAVRGVFGTPTFFVNGFAVSDSGSTITYEAWKSYIDPLVTARGVKGTDETEPYFEEGLALRDRV